MECVNDSSKQWKLQLAAKKAVYDRVSRMKRTHGSSAFESQIIRDNVEGYSGLELRSEKKGVSRTVAKVIFWDAEGQYSVETFGEVPLTILRDLIEEAKEVVGVPLHD